MNVRRATPEDEEIVRRVRLESLADSPRDFEGSLESESARATEDWGEWIARGPLFLVQGPDRPAGLAACAPHRTDRTARFLEAMWVHPDVRGTGAADALLAAVCDWARGHGHAVVHLEVVETNDRARRFYERNGFRPTGRKVVRERDGIVEIEMRGDLDPRLELIEPTPDLEEDFLAMVRGWREAGRDRWYAGALHDFHGYLRRLSKQRSADGLPRGRVPSFAYWLVADGRRIVGTSRLRPALLSHLEKEGGHIGYDVRPAERRKGYGTALLARTLDRARSRGLDEVLITCDHDNVGSVRIIENNGGTLLGQVVSDRTGNTVNRYRIVL